VCVSFSYVTRLFLDIRETFIRAEVKSACLDRSVDRFAARSWSTVIVRCTPLFLWSYPITGATRKPRNGFRNRFRCRHDMEKQPPSTRNVPRASRTTCWVAEFLSEWPRWTARRVLNIRPESYSLYSKAMVDLPEQIRGFLSRQFGDRNRALADRFCEENKRSNMRSRKIAAGFQSVIRSTLFVIISNRYYRNVKFIRSERSFSKCAILIRRFSMKLHVARRHRARHYRNYSHNARIIRRLIKISRFFPFGGLACRDESHACTIAPSFYSMKRAIG